MNIKIFLNQRLLFVVVLLFDSFEIIKNRNMKILHLSIIYLLVFVFTIVGNAQKKNLYKSIIEKELIFTPQHEHTHGSSIVALPNGDLIAAWFQGNGERNSDDVLIMEAHLEKGEKEWSKPFLMADTPGLPDCNPVLFLNNKIVLKNT